MLKKDFWYDLPKELIAQEPANPRDAARLMVLVFGLSLFSIVVVNTLMETHHSFIKP